MGILVNLYLNNSFRPVKHAVKAPEHFCVTRIKVANNAKKNEEKNLKISCAKEIKTDPRATFMGFVTIQSAGVDKVP